MTDTPEEKTDVEKTRDMLEIFQDLPRFSGALFYGAFFAITALVLVLETWLLGLW